MNKSTPRSSVSRTHSSYSLSSHSSKSEASSSASATITSDSDHSDSQSEVSDLSDSSLLSSFEDSFQTRSAPSRRSFGSPFDSQSDVDDDSRQANSASEDSDPVIPPANTPPGPAQPTMQLSEDPAMAALGKNQLAAAAAVVLYATCLAILENALNDPQSILPRDSFSNLRRMYGGLLQDNEARAQELAAEHTRVLTQHGEQAKALAAQADRGTSPVAADTFSTNPRTVEMPPDWKQVHQEVKQLPPQTRQGLIVEGVRAAHREISPASVADLDRELDQVLRDPENARTEGEDPQPGELDRQLQKEEAEPTHKVSEEIEALGRDSQALSNFKFPDDAVDEDWSEFDIPTAPLTKTGPGKTLTTQEYLDELDELLQDMNPASRASTTDGPMLTHTASQQQADLDAEQNALLADADNELLANVEELLPSADSKSSTHAVTSPQIPHTQEDLTKPVAVSNEEFIELEAKEPAFYTSELTKLDDELQLTSVWNRELTSDEVSQRKRLAKNGGSAADFRANLLNDERIAVVRKFQNEWNKEIDSKQEAVILIRSGKLMADATHHGRQLHLAQLNARKKTLLDLIQTGNDIIANRFNKNHK